MIRNGNKQSVRNCQILVQHEIDFQITGFQSVRSRQTTWNSKPELNYWSFGGFLMQVFPGTNARVCPGPVFQTWNGKLQSHIEQLTADHQFSFLHLIYLCLGWVSYQKWYTVMHTSPFLKPCQTLSYLTHFACKNEGTFPAFLDSLLLFFWGGLQYYQPWNCICPLFKFNKP